MSYNKELFGKGNPLPNFLSVDEIKRILETIKLKDYEAIRNRAIMELLYSSGLRISEALGITIADMDTKAKTVKVKGKGDTQRIVPITNRFINALKAYWSCGRAKQFQGRKEQALFLTEWRSRVNASYIRRMFAQYAKQAGIERANPHAFRHSYATHLVERGADIAVVKELLGHAHIENTMVYVHLSGSRVRETVDRLHALKD